VIVSQMQAKIRLWGDRLARSADEGVQPLAVATLEVGGEVVV